jgi:hypothetical protein
VIDGKPRTIGETFLVSVPEHQAYVSVHLEEGGFELDYEGTKVACLRHEVVHEPVNPVDSTFNWVVRMLSSPPRLIIMGRGYAHSFPMAQASSVRASLAKIPEKAELWHVDSFGRNNYKALTIDGYLWTTDIIRDIVEK